MSRIHLSFLSPGKNSGYKDTVTDIYYKGMNVGYILENKDNFRDDTKNYMAYRFALWQPIFYHLRGEGEVQSLVRTRRRGHLREVSAQGQAAVRHRT